MQKMTDAQWLAAGLLGHGKPAIKDEPNKWHIKLDFTYFIKETTMQSLVRLGLVKIDGNVATLTEGAEKDG